MERTPPKKPETVAESKYEPTDYERAVLAKQAQRLKDQVRVPRIRFVEDQRGGRWEFDHPDQTIAFALVQEAFGTADDQSANGLIHYLCAVLPADENSAFDYPRADDLNRAISIIAAGKAVDEFHANIFADLAVCRITIERLLHNLREPVRFYLPEELRFALQYYEYDPKGQIDREVKIDNRPVLEFSVKSATRLMTTCVELITAANRYRATFESSMKMQQLSAVTPVETSLGKINHATPNATPKKANAARARRLNGLPSGAENKFNHGPKRQWPHTDVILARCWRAHVVGRRHAPAKPACRLRLVGRDDAGCMAGQRDLARRAGTRMRSPTDSTYAKLKPSGRKYVAWYSIRAT